MPDFAYTARTLDGQRLEGTLQAASQREALATLSGRDLFPLSVGTIGKQPTAAEGSPRVRSKYITPVYSQLASLLRSGVPMLRSLQVIREQASNPQLAFVLEDIKNRVEDGATLSDAMARHPKAFGELAVSVVRAGSEGGFLEDSLERVAAFTDQQEELRSRVVGALAYPVVIAVIGAIVVNGLIIFAVPMVEGLFARLKERGELPMVTEWLLLLSAFLQSYWWLAIAGIVGVVYGFSRWSASERGRNVLDRVKLKVPTVGPIYLNLAVARFCRVLGTLLKGGVPIVRSLEIAADSTGNRVLEQTVRDASDHITSGEPLAGPLAASGHFPRDVCEMIAVAEQANSLEIVLNQISDNLEKSTWRKIELFVRLLEPLLLLVLASAVLVVVIALLLPIIKASTTL
ncbi:Putative type II secretion system protein F [Pirellulimonas nuda]|uniref:Type II secretion system protein F n=1 Tax=Pirellulimonas nuda TaxID=2528009 RepID=A0A518DES9_9BACT|nr:type II secretion system F family protein [Pirellulimonas nuda]QDU89985.1 Putative type II secretion system protein F [Pirellulimonas nuda]